MKTIITTIICIWASVGYNFGQCATSLFLSSPITSSYAAEVSQHIIAENTITSATATVIYKAGESVVFLQGFTTNLTNSAYLRAYISPCGVWKQTDTTTIAETIIKETTLLAYPNPFSDDITVEYSLTKGETGQLYVYSILGQLIVTQALDNATTETQQLSLKTETWAAGIYILSLQQQNGEKKTIKVIKE